MPDKGDKIIITDHQYIDPPDFISSAMMAHTVLEVVYIEDEFFVVSPFGLSEDSPREDSYQILFFMVEYDVVGQAGSIVSGSITIQPS